MTKDGTVGESQQDGNPKGSSVKPGTPKGANQGGAPDAAKLQEIEARYKQDFATLRSNYDRKLDQIQRQLQEERAAWSEQLRKAQMASMDDDQKKQFLSQSKEEELQQKVRELEQREAEIKRKADMVEWRQWFIEQGVPASKLDMSDPEALLQSGWTAHGEMVNSMKSELEKFKSGQQASESASEEEAGEVEEDASAPVVLPPSGGKPAKGASWDDMVKKYGSTEEVFKAVEQGDLSPDVLPK